MNLRQVLSDGSPHGEMDPRKSFFRHRADCDYLVKGLKIYRMADGLVAFTVHDGRKRAALIRWLRTGRYAARVKVLPDG